MKESHQRLDEGFNLLRSSDLNEHGLQFGEEMLKMGR